MGVCGGGLSFGWVWKGRGKLNPKGSRHAFGSRPLGLEDWDTDSLKTALAPQSYLSQSLHVWRQLLLISVLSMLRPVTLWTLSLALHRRCHSGHQDLTLPGCSQSPPTPFSPGLIHSSLHCSQSEFLQIAIELLPAPQSLQKEQVPQRMYPSPSSYLREAISGCNVELGGIGVFWWGSSFGPWLFLLNLSVKFFTCKLEIIIVHISEGSCAG